MTCRRGWTERECFKQEEQERLRTRKTQRDRQDRDGPCRQMREVKWEDGKSTIKSTEWGNWEILKGKISDSSRWCGPVLKRDKSLYVQEEAEVGTATQRTLRKTNGDIHGSREWGHGVNRGDRRWQIRLDGDHWIAALLSAAKRRKGNKKAIQAELQVPKHTRVRGVDANTRRADVNDWTAVSHPYLALRRSGANAALQPSRRADWNRRTHKRVCTVGPVLLLMRGRANPALKHSWRTPVSNSYSARGSEEPGFKPRSRTSA